MKRWISVWLGLTFVICFGSFLSSHVHIADQGHFSHLEKRLHILGRHYFELQHGRESSEIVESIPSFLLHLFDFDHDQAPFDEEAGDGIEEEEDDDDYDDDDEEEEEVEEQLTQEELDKLAAKEFSSEESTAGDEESEEGREKSNLEKVRRKRRRRRARLRRSHPNISVHRGGSGVVAPRSRVAPGSRAFNSSKGPLLHPPLKKYVESCRGSCVLKNLRRQNTKLSSSYFNTSHFDADVFFDDESECKGKCGVHGYCKEGKCICVALYEGDYCEHPIHLPHGLHADFSRDFLLNAESLKDSVGKVMSYKTNPKAGSGETHTLKLSVSQDMVNLIPESDFLRNKFFNTCAIVGSSGVLLSTMKGSEIDEHSAVIRFNKAPTKGFETYVGSKTTLRLVNTNHALFRQGNETIVQQMQSRTGWMIYRKILKMENEIPHYVFHPDFSSFVSSNTRALPTNGYFALWLALQKCSTVTMYGFYHSAGFSFPYHYFNREVPRKGGAAIHDYQAELEDILRLAKADVIHLSELCMSECHDWNNIRHYECKTCPKGSTCMCNTDMPIPVAKPGYCHPKHRRSCFVKCPGGVKQCPPVHVGDKRILGSTGRCPSEVEKTITKDSCP